MTDALTRPQRALGRRRKVVVGARILRAYLQVRVALWRKELPGAVAAARECRVRPGPKLAAQQLGRAVSRTLRLGSYRPRCLFTSLTLFRLLHEQGDEAALVIGLPSRPEDGDAHAWVEVSGVDVGPPPGQSGHVELARYD
jgi:hypothetical protein